MRPFCPFCPGGENLPATTPGIHGAALGSLLAFLGLILRGKKKLKGFGDGGERKR